MDKIVKDNIKRMKYQVRNGVSTSSIEKDFSEFKTSYPKLYAMILEDGDYDHILDALLEAADAVKSGETTQEEMDKTVGFKLAQKYVYPNIDMHKETRDYVAKQMRESDELENKIAAKFRKWDEEEAAE